MMTDIRLEPCPFCGRSVQYNFNIDLVPDGIRCDQCHYIVRFTRIKLRPHDRCEVPMKAMMEIWNRRANNG